MPSAKNTQALYTLHPGAIHYLQFGTHLVQSENLVIMLRETWNVCCMAENPKFPFFNHLSSCCF
jgi:hypothetical protein